MGGLSAAELLCGPTVPREGHFVENCLQNLRDEPERLSDDDEPNYDDDSDKEGKVSDPNLQQSISNIELLEYSTIVGTELHGITVDDGYEEDSRGVIQLLPYDPISSSPSSNPTNSFLTRTSLFPTPGLMKRSLESSG